MQIQFKRLYKQEDFPLLLLCDYPTYQTEGSAGVDLRAMIPNAVQLQPGESMAISSGLAAHIANPRHFGLLTLRSSIGIRGLALVNGVGIIDSDYQGPITIVVRNTTSAPIMINSGERIAQLLIMPVTQATFIQTDYFETNTVRGAGGFGSTGTN